MFLLEGKWEAEPSDRAARIRRKLRSAYPWLSKASPSPYPLDRIRLRRQMSKEFKQLLKWREADGSRGDEEMGECVCVCGPFWGGKGNTEIRFLGVLFVHSHRATDGVGLPVVPFDPCFGEGSPTRLQKTGYPYSNLSTGEPSGVCLFYVERTDLGIKLMKVLCLRIFCKICRWNF